MKNIRIIGGGAAALILAAHLDTKKYNVTVYERKKAMGRKFLVAGEGGLNLTYNAPVETIIEQYSPSVFIAPVIRQFTNYDLMHWLKSLNVETFVGSSNRVFPDLKLKPIEVLKKILDYITNKKIEFSYNSNWMGWTEKGSLCFENAEEIASDITIFALGGASWKVTGSDGAWSKVFEAQGIEIKPFRAANCAFGVAWNKNFITTHEGKPLKNIAVSFNDYSAKGELVISKFGLEGNAIYALSEKIQAEFLQKENALIQLDLKPTMTTNQLKAKIKNSRFTKVSDILKQDIKLDRTSVGLLKHFTNKDVFLNFDLLANAIKSVPITLSAVDEMDKAISTLGGISLDEIDENFQLKKMPDTYVIGEMLDWYAPTGGYLLQGCFSMGFTLAKHLNGLEDSKKMLTSPYV